MHAGVVAFLGWFCEGRYAWPVPRYKLTLAYDGTDFCGWQKQEPPAGSGVPAGRVMPPDGSIEGEDGSGTGVGRRGEGRMVLRTVQEVLERGLARVLRRRVVTLGASRTDAGVHARGQVVAFTCDDEAWPVSRGLEGLRRALNGKLPEDVRVESVEVVDDGFDPVTGAVSKAYSYTLHISPDRPLWDRRVVHHVWTPLDVGAMREVADVLVGEHDFAGFAAAGHGRLTTVRRVLAVRVVEVDLGAGDGASAAGWSGRVRLEVEGTGFLWNMVRIMAGTLVEAGRGRIDVGRVREALRTGDRRLAGPTLPPTGLCLEWVRYAGGCGGVA